jgi:hypothetical protein
MIARPGHISAYIGERSMTQPEEVEDLSNEFCPWACSHLVRMNGTAECAAWDTRLIRVGAVDVCRCGECLKHDVNLTENNYEDRFTRSA